MQSRSPLSSLVQVLREDLALKADINLKCQEFLAIVPNNEGTELNNVLFTFIIAL